MSMNLLQIIPLIPKKDRENVLSDLSFHTRTSIDEVQFVSVDKVLFTIKNLKCKCSQCLYYPNMFEAAYARFQERERKTKVGDR